MVDLSIIIPVYNTEQFLARCIESCLDLDINSKTYEIIIVDDGSTDDSLVISRNYEQKHSNVKVFSQKNQKQGAARNHGLRYAKGYYIWFVDSDDWVKVSLESKIRTEIKNKKFDVIGFNGDKVDDTENFQSNFNRFTQNNYTEKYSLLVGEGGYNSCVPLYIFRKNFLDKNQIRFLENIFFEDNEFIFRVFDCTPNFLPLKETLYVIRLRLNSTTRTKDYKRFLDLFNTISTLVSFRKNQNISTDILMIDILIFRTINQLLYSTLPSKSIFNRACKMLKNQKEIGKNISPKHSLQHKMQIKLLKSPKILRLIMLIYYKIKREKNV